MRASYISDFEQWKKEFSFSAPVKVRFSETDMYGHLNNTVPFTYFEFARIEYMKHIGLMQAYLDPAGDAMPVVADMQCDYVRQVFFDERLNIYVKAERVGTSSVDLHYWGVNGDGETCLTGRGTMVQISRSTGKGKPWSEEDRILLLNRQDASV